MDNLCDWLASWLVLDMSEQTTDAPVVLMPISAVALQLGRHRQAGSDPPARNLAISESTNPKHILYIHN
jgi:hypothetical protein